MADKNYSSTTPNKRNRPPRKKAVETNAKQDDVNKANESCSYYSSRTSSGNVFHGMNIFDYYSPETIVALVKDPMEYNDILRKLSLTLYSSCGIYTQTVDYLTSIPTLDNVIVTHGRSEKKKKINKEKMLSTLRVIKHKEIVRDALLKGMLEGVAFYYFETTNRQTSAQKYMSDYDVSCISEINDAGINASIISLPVDYTQIVGIKNSSYVIAFNLDYFDDCSGESCEQKLRKYPKEIRDAYSNRIRQDGNSGNWVVLDSSKTIVHKIRSKRDEKWGRPLVLAAINDILYGDYFIDTKRNVLDEINNRIVYETFPEGREKGVSALTKAQQEKQHNAVKNAVLNKNNRGGTSFFSVAAGTKIGSIDPTNTDIFDDKYESNLDDRIALDMGIAASLLNGTSSGSYSAQENNLELLSSQLFQWIEQIENELNKCINENIINDSKNWAECKYLPITNVNKSNMVGYAKDLYLSGKGSLSLWAASCGISPEVFFALLDEELEENIDGKYPVHATSYTTSGNNSDSNVGRPEVENPKNKSTLQTKANGNNNMPKPSVNHG